MFLKYCNTFSTNTPFSYTIILVSVERMFHIFKNMLFQKAASGTTMFKLKTKFSKINFHIRRFYEINWIIIKANIRVYVHVIDIIH